MCCSFDRYAISVRLSIDVSGKEENGATRE
jgi:hypothetical protein